MKTSSLFLATSLAVGTFLAGGCGSNHAKEQAQAEARDEQAEQEANKGLAKVDHDIAAGLYGPKPAQPAPSSQPTPSKTPTPANTAPNPTPPPQ
jgi:hypothetical protein